MPWPVGAGFMAVPCLAPAFEPSNEVLEPNARGPAHLPNLQEGEPPLPRFVLAHVGLGATEPLRHVALPKPGVLPDLPKQLQEALALRS